MFLLEYFSSVEVCLEGVFPHYVSTRWDPCLRVYAPLTLALPPPTPLARKQNRTGVTRLSTCTKRWGIWTDAWVCLHYWVVSWVAGWFNFQISTCIAKSMGYVIYRIHYGLKVVLYFRHFTVFHYHHYARFIADIEHILMPVEYLVEVCLTYC